MFSKHTRLVKHLPALPVLWLLPVRREGQFAPGVFPSREGTPCHLQQISSKYPWVVVTRERWTVRAMKTFGDFFPGNLNESVADP